MVSLACFIILVHAFVPHHHHDFDNSVCFVFHAIHHEDSHVDGSDVCDFEEGCCNEEKAPFELCKLQELLSCLILSNREEDDQSFAQLSIVDVIVSYALCDLDTSVAFEISLFGPDLYGQIVFSEDFPNASALRAPPLC